MGGSPKALLEVGGRRIVERVVHAIRPVVDDLLLVTNTPDLYAFLDLPMVGDVVPGAGALGGIYSGLQAAAGDAAFTVACDMPFLRADVARLVVERAPLGDVVVPVVRGQYETLHACYRKSCLPHMAACLAARQLKIVGFFPRVRVVEVPEGEIACLADPTVVFMNVNTPEEFERARALAERFDR